MTQKRLFNVMVILVFMAGLMGVFTDVPGTASASTAVRAEDKIEPALMNKFNLEGTAEFIVRFGVQADLSPAYEMDWAARGEFVYKMLQETASLSQSRAKGLLSASGLEHRTFIAGNELLVKQGNLDVAIRLASLDEVSYIRATRVYSIAPMESGSPLGSIRWSGDLLSYNLNANLGSVDAVTAWGIVDTKADQFWTTFNVQGEGIIVANIDTGVQYNHPALDQSFACKDDPSNPACWLDAINECTGDVPCDTHGHGTHVMGTMVADDDPELVFIAGMAPDAEWIACKACDDGGRCTDEGLNICADWMLAPGDNPQNRPNIVNNSWSYQGGDTWFVEKVEAWRAAGIFPSFVAGNFGSACATIGSPGDYQVSFASAAHDSARKIAWFSGRGPSDFGHEPYTKPNISAPGVNICSSVPNNTWDCEVSGTSQAAPHSAGAVALLWSCNPMLVGQIDLTYQILHYTANLPPAGTCGAPEDGQGNYTFGYGYLDILAAGNAYCGAIDMGTVEGYVFDNHGNPLEGVSINAQPSAPAMQDAGIQSISDPTGYYTMDLLTGTYDLTAYKESYDLQTLYDIEVIKDTVTRAPAFSLDYLGVWTQLEKFSGCPEWTRYDGEYFPGNEKIYFLGGRSGTSTYGDIYALDLALSQCTDTGIDMPVAISNYTIVPLEIGGTDVLCTFGGRDASGVNTNAVQCYDPVANSVSQPTTLPVSMATYIPGGTVAVNNTAYIFGGLAYTAPNEISETWKWNPEMNTWTQLGNMIKGVSYPQSTVVDGLIYSFGGSIYDITNLEYPLVAQKIAQVLNPATGLWTQLADMPTAGAEGRAFGFDTGTDYELTKQVVVTGGGLFPSETAEVFLYDIASNTYDYTFADLNISRRDHAGVLVPGDPGEPLTMWVFGGRTSAVGYGKDEPPYAPPEFYQVELAVPRILIYPDQIAKNVLEDTPRSTSFDIMNIGAGTLSWNISEGITDIPWVSVDPISGENNTAVGVTFDPQGLDLGVYTATLIVNSNDAFESVVNMPITMSVVIQDAGLTLTPDTDAKSGDPGEVVDYSLVLENTGNYIDTYTIKASGDWDVDLPVTSIELEDGERAAIHALVQVPPDALPGDIGVINITAASVFDTHSSEISELTTTTNQVYALSLEPPTGSAESGPGKTVTYRLTLTNQGNGDDTVSLSMSGNLWTVKLSTTSISVAAGDLVEFLVNVTIPATAADGDEDSVTVTATSEGGTYDSSVLTTTAKYYHVVLPMVFKY